MDDSQDQDVTTHGNQSELQPSVDAHPNYRRRLAYADCTHRNMFGSLSYSIPSSSSLTYILLQSQPHAALQTTRHRHREPVRAREQLSGFIVEQYPEHCTVYGRDSVAKCGGRGSRGGAANVRERRECHVGGEERALRLVIHHTFSPLIHLPTLTPNPTHYHLLIPPSGGHINPLITFSTTMTKLCSLPRCILYLIAQTAGATVGGLLLSVSISDEAEIEKTLLGACWFDSTLNSVRSVVIMEIMFSWALVFLAFGVALDPRQQKVGNNMRWCWWAGATRAKLLSNKSAMQQCLSFCSGKLGLWSRSRPHLCRVDLGSNDFY
ncbi:hypothetical protein BC937DRAFT_90621 [Endogone sp. FLAS-F59071]|nr:hypothetical protein BC937DRAFT_90621 [Endogone sp. FLAS-F59071]|eukprot:RUS22033.1 hypothetical protein BC937DRAFT_90621 [Endogone sp. FLAS-F59071]